MLQCEQMRMDLGLRLRAKDLNSGNGNPFVTRSFSHEVLVVHRHMSEFYLVLIFPCFFPYYFAFLF